MLPTNSALIPDLNFINDAIIFDCSAAQRYNFTIEIDNVPSHIAQRFCITTHTAILTKSTFEIRKFTAVDETSPTCYINELQNVLTIKLTLYNKQAHPAASEKLIVSFVAYLNTINIANNIAENIYQFKILKLFDIDKFKQDE